MCVSMENMTFTEPGGREVVPETVESFSQANLEKDNREVELSSLQNECTVMASAPQLEQCKGFHGSADFVSSDKKPVSRSYNVNFTEQHKDEVVAIDVDDEDGPSRKKGRLGFIISSSN